MLTYILEDVKLVGDRNIIKVVEVQDGECLASSADQLPSAARGMLLVLRN